MFLRKELLIFAFWFLPFAVFAESTEWSNVGLRIEIREVLLPIGPTRLPYVIAVQQDGPAFYAGVQPGDVVSFLKCGKWNINFIDNLSNSGTYFRNYTSVGNQNFKDAYHVNSYCQTERGALISTVIPPGDARLTNELKVFRTAKPGSGAWLSDKNEIATNLSNARASESNVHTELRNRAEAELRKSPCSYDVSNPYNLAAMPPIIREMSAAAAAAGRGEENLLFWRDVVQLLCDEERNGKLPSFESALFRMSWGRLDPCKYDPNVDYSNVPLDPDRRERRYSRTEYESVKDFDYMLKVLLNDDQRKCFNDLIRNPGAGK
ncbi:hypothetical protein [Nitrosomonas ureae]|uniref:Uncharacterized protein n=1 Tax=Nitrosomonas ureae TaxID=44577 RepID=A0A1H9FGT2_9PROT|nr:hypothetical protein [Nitrosomonas ureae]SEQ37136.1 hypothetical protein SAMN05421510_10439 [Nitrosomonas ureae]